MAPIMTTPISASAEPDIVRSLRAAGCVFAEDEAALLIEAAGSPAELATSVQRRITGEPLEVILGWAEFAGLRIGIAAGVFVPRRRTEYLVRQARKLASPAAVVVDLCCGSGALGAALATELPGIRLFASDIEPAAVRCAANNLEGIGEVFEGDLFDALPVSLRGEIDILLVNAPYVPSSEIAGMPPEARVYEPQVALDGGGDGLDIHRRVAAEAPHWLAPSGTLLIEVSAQQSAEAVRIFGTAGLTARVAHSKKRDATVVLGTRR
jgi:release factor glutamine methyltransferase